MAVSSTSQKKRKVKGMAVPPMSRPVKILLSALLVTFVCIGWVAKGAWAERVAHQQLSLESELKAMLNEANDLKQQLLQLSEFAKVETEARERLGMDYPASAPDKIWTDVPVEQPLLGTMAFFSTIQRDPPSSRQY